MPPGAATVICTVVIRENFNRARSLNRSEARQDQKDQQDAAHFVTALESRRDLTGHAHT